MIRTLCLAWTLGWTLGCSPVLETACFGYLDLPDAEDVVVRVPVAGEEYDARPQTEAEAEAATWDRMRATFLGSSSDIMCVIDEGTVHCQAGALGPTSFAPGTPLWSCRWRHPEEDRIPQGARRYVFFPEGVPPVTDPSVGPGGG